MSMAPISAVHNPSLSFFKSSLSPKPSSLCLSPHSLSLHFSPASKRRFPSLRFHSINPIPGDNPTGGEKPIKITDEWGEETDPQAELINPDAGDNPTGGKKPIKITDEWGEETEPQAEPTRLSDSDPPKDEDEWGRSGVESYVAGGNGSPAQGKSAEERERIEELKRCLVDTVYGTELGFRAGQEVRAEVLELVNQLEMVNPTPAPVEAADLLNGNWVLLYTAFSELLPLLAAGAIPLVKVEKICQSIDTSTQAIVNSTTLSNPFATFSFSASATFEVRSPTRIQVEFKEGKLKPPEIKANIDLPDNVDVFGQKINLIPVQQPLNRLQEAVAGLTRGISGQAPLKVPIPGDQTKSWLLITYLDEDLRISRGDGGLFVLAREGSPFLSQY